MDFAAARYKMIQHQIRTNRVTDPLIIAAMSEVPRERFVAESQRGIAYADEDIPLGSGRFLIAPLATALLLQAAEIGSDDVVLDVGCGTGYISAVVAEMTGAVLALENDAELAERASTTLADLGMNTVTVIPGPVNRGYPEQAPYDVIVFGGAVAEVPAVILDQLAEGGRLVAVVVGEGGIGRGMLFLRCAGTVSRRPLFEMTIPILPEFSPEPTFRF